MIGAPTIALTPLAEARGRTSLSIVGAWTAATLALWTVAAPTVLPRPWEIATALVDLLRNGSLAYHLVSSLVLNVEAVLLSTALSLGLTYLSVLPLLRPVARFVASLRFLGLVGITFAFGLLVSGHGLKLAILTFGMTVFLTTGLLAHVAGLDTEAYDHARTLRMGGWRVVYEVIVLGTIDEALSLLAQNAAIGWMMLTTVEGLVRGEGGLGALLLNENRHLNLGAVYALQGLLFAIGLLQDAALGRLRAAVCPWSTVGKGVR